MEKRDIYILRVLGLFLFFVSLVSILNSFRYASYSSLLWFSNLAVLLIGAGLLFRSSFLIASQVSIIFIPHLIWIVDLIYRIVFSRSLWGYTDYLFLSTDMLANFVSFSHIFIIPIWFYALFVLKIKKNNFWIISLVQIVLVYFLTRLFTNPDNNLNCVFENCFSLFPTLFNSYTFTWFFACGLMIGIVNYLLIKVPIFRGK